MSRLLSKKILCFSVYIFIIFTWTFYRYFLVTPEWVDEFIAKPLLQVLPVLFVVKFFEKNPLNSLSIGSKRPLLHVSIGLGLGLLLVAESLILQKIKGTVFTIQLNNLLAPFLVSLATGFTEELVYRGYFARRIADSIENPHIANAIQTVMFVLIHVPIMIFVLHYSFADSLLYSLQLFVLGFVYGYIFLETESIVTTIIPHTLWNFANVIFH